MVDIEYRDVIKLQSEDLIANEMAERQLKVIQKAYNFLKEKKNNIIYIADEVGLGKTYIALGIITLFRHYKSPDDLHKDIIIVPKRNLQGKWAKTIMSFVKNNYLHFDEDTLNIFQANISTQDRLYPIAPDSHTTIYRMSSFSSLAAPRSNPNDLLVHLKDHVFSGNKFAADILKQVWAHGYFEDNDDKRFDLRKIVAYLLNAVAPKIQCLIVDEAHNYKHGLGNGTLRNELTARFLGTVNDKELLDEFPMLRDKIRFPLSEKVICLSATPKDRNLIEIRNQFNCFRNDHILSDVQTNEDVSLLLKKFLIRGNLEYQIQNNMVSRNQCRFEHRRGNVNKAPEPIPLITEDSFESIFWQLTQYQSIKHLEQKNNASFEIGMLAGFESYLTDHDKKIQRRHHESDNPDEKEYDLKSIKGESQDINILRNIVKSYHDTFNNELPPHPKQSKLESELLNQVIIQEKSLVFVRRIATSYELEKRLLNLYEQCIVYNKQLSFTGRFSKFKTKDVVDMLDEYKDNNLLEYRTSFFNNFLARADVISTLKEKISDPVELSQKGMDWLLYCYLNHENSILKKELRPFLLKKRKNIPAEFKKSVLTYMLDCYNSFKLSEENEDEESNDDADDTGFFFLNYFKKDRLGFKFRRRTYRENWYDIDLVDLLNKYNFIDISLQVVADDSFNESAKKKSQIFKNKQNSIYTSILENGTLITPQITEINLHSSTFITYLLGDLCKNSFEKWLYKRVRKNKLKDLIEDIKALNAIIKNIFRNGSGLLAAFVAGSITQDFNSALKELIFDNDAPFHFVKTEIETILRDFDFICNINFENKEERHIEQVMRNLTPVVGTSGQDKRNRSLIASQFRMPGFPYILITTDVFKEGEDLHSYCQNIYHYGVAWNPSDMEQRTGRIDRINSLSYRKLNRNQNLDFDNKVQVFYPYLMQSIEVNQVSKLLTNMNSFIETFNQIEQKSDFESAVGINTQITEDNMPPAINEKLKSIYDVDDFNLNN